MRTLLGMANVVLLVGVVVCCAGAMAGLIVILPFVAGAWALNLVALLGYEEGRVAAAPSVARQDAIAEADPGARSASGTSLVPTAVSVNSRQRPTYLSR